MRTETMQLIFDKIREYDTIMLFRHIRPDGDAKGSTKGLQEILRATWPEKSVYLINNDHSDVLAFMGPEDPEVGDQVYAQALGIVLDTATPERISNKKYRLCKELIKIDHHIDVAPYGNYSWVDHKKSSASEMIAEFYSAFSHTLRLNKQAATYIYTGMVTDSGRFQFDSVTGDTLRYAGLMLDQGIDTNILFAHLYLQDFNELKFRAQLQKAVKITENGVAYLYLSRAAMEKYGLTDEAASACVSCMESIRGCLCWMIFIENGDEAKSIRVRLRSRFVHINEIAERYRGGGHACACGATVYNRKEVRALVQEADAAVLAYKQTHEDWL